MQLSCVLSCIGNLPYCLQLSYLCVCVRERETKRKQCIQTLQLHLVGGMGTSISTPFFQKLCSGLHFQKNLQNSKARCTVYFLFAPLKLFCTNLYPRKLSSTNCSIYAFLPSGFPLGLVMELLQKMIRSSLGRTKRKMLE